jgi:hypothetical protein
MAGLLGATMLAGCMATPGGPGVHPNIQPGSWELGLATEVKGMAPLLNHATRCMKPEEVKDAQTFAEQSRHGADCTFADWQAESGKVSYTFACSHDVHGTAEWKFYGTAFEGVVKITHQYGTTTVSHFYAKRLGDC